MCNHFQSSRFCKWWAMRPKTTNIFPSLFSFSNRTLKWLNPSLDNLASLPWSNISFSCSTSVWPLQLTSQTIAFYRTYLFLHLDSIIIFLTGWKLYLLLGHVCFQLDIWTVRSHTAHRPVIREVNDNSEVCTGCQAIDLCLECCYVLHIERFISLKWYHLQHIKW